MSKIEFDLQIACPGWPDETALDTLLSKSLTAWEAHLADHPEAAGELPLGLGDGMEVSFLFTSDAAVQQLNAQWRNKDKPTNVLSFAANDGVPRQAWSALLGDVVFALETVQREAQEQEKTFEAHLTHLVIHGFLHLLGHDHLEDAEANEMEALERNILAELGIADPYRDN